MASDLALDRLHNGEANPALKELDPVDPTRSNPNPNCGERALLRAVLQDAVLCLTGQGVPKRERARVAAEARQWMLSRSRRWLFAFESICDVLDINAEYLRDKLLRHRRPVMQPVVRRSIRLRGNQQPRRLRAHGAAGGTGARSRSRSGTVPR